jgi:hypothetical protein
LNVKGTWYAGEAANADVNAIVAGAAEDFINKLESSVMSR